MKRDQLQKHFASTYFGLRLGIVVFSFALPLILYFGGRIRGVDLAPSISDYYFAVPEGATISSAGVMRDWFVGILFAVAGFLYLYKGFSKLENVLLNAGGVLLAAVALIPCACQGGSTSSGVSLHGVAAVGFFLIMAVVVFKCAKETLPLLKKKNPQLHDAYKMRYHVIAGLLVLSPVAAVVASFQYGSLTFFVETFAIYVFATYWAVKSRELKHTQAEMVVLEKRAKTDPEGRIVDEANTVSV